MPVTEDQNIDLNGNKERSFAAGTQDDESVIRDNWAHFQPTESFQPSFAGTQPEEQPAQGDGQKAHAENLNLFAPPADSSEPVQKAADLLKELYPALAGDIDNGRQKGMSDEDIFMSLEDTCIEMMAEKGYTPEQLDKLLERTTETKQRAQDLMLDDKLSVLGKLTGLHRDEVAARIESTAYLGYAPSAFLLNEDLWNARKSAVEPWKNWFEALWMSYDAKQKQSRFSEGYGVNSIASALAGKMGPAEKAEFLKAYDAMRGQTQRKRSASVFQTMAAATGDIGGLIARHVQKSLEWELPFAAAMVGYASMKTGSLGLTPFGAAAGAGGATLAAAKAGVGAVFDAMNASSAAALGSQAANYLTTMPLEGLDIFAEALRKGADPRLAALYATGGGFVNAIIERGLLSSAGKVLGRLAPRGMSKAFKETVISRAAGKVVKQAVKGLPVPAQIVLTQAFNLLPNTLSEALEEPAQGTVSKIAETGALVQSGKKSLEEGVSDIFSKETLQQAEAEFTEAGKEFFAAGVVPTVANMVLSLLGYRTFKKSPQGQALARYEASLKDGGQSDAKEDARNVYISKDALQTFKQSLLDKQKSKAETVIAEQVSAAEEAAAEEHQTAAEENTTGELPAGGETAVAESGVEEQGGAEESMTAPSIEEQLGISDADLVESTGEYRIDREKFNAVAKANPVFANAVADHVRIGAFGMTAAEAAKKINGIVADPLNADNEYAQSARKVYEEALAGFKEIGKSDEEAEASARIYAKYLLARSISHSNRLSPEGLPMRKKVLAEDLHKLEVRKFEEQQNRTAQQAAAEDIAQTNSGVFNQELFQPEDYDENGRIRPEVIREITDELNAIRTEAQANGTYLMAENGNRSNLPAGVWEMVRTRRFREWFGSSQVVDENGEPKVMYHGTPDGSFVAFRPGAYFSSEQQYADRYQNPSASSISTGKQALNPKTFAVFLDIKKPFDLSDPEARRIFINEYIKGGNALGINPYLSNQEYAKIKSIDWTEGEDLKDFLQENGYDYDSILLDEGGDPDGSGGVTRRGDSYLVFSPEQIKSVDNRGTFDSSANIYNQSAAPARTQDQTQTPAFKRWFGDSKVVDENGAPLVLYHQTAEEFSEFDPRHKGAGSTDYETPYGIFLKPTDKDIGLQGKTQMGLYARITNPFTVKDRSQIAHALKENETYVKAMDGIKANDTKYHARFEALDKKWSELAQNAKDRRYTPEMERVEAEQEAVLEEWRSANGELERQAKEELTTWLRQNGYDGMIIENDRGSFGRNVKTYIALDPNQVKSATGNRGTFDSSGNIYNQSAWHGTDAKFDRFDMNKTQRRLHGYGLYFAKNREGAAQYRRAMTEGEPGSYTFEVAGKSVDEKTDRLLRLNSTDAELYQASTGKADALKEHLSKNLRYYKEMIAEDTRRINNYQEQAEYLQSHPEMSVEDFRQHVKNMPFAQRQFYSGILDSAQTIDDVQKAIADETQKNKNRKKETAAIVKALSQIDLSNLEVTLHDPGYLYEVDIPEDNVLLNDQKPLSEHPAEVKKGIRKILQNLTNEQIEDLGQDVNSIGRSKAISNIWEMLSDADGETLYGTLVDAFGGDRETSEALNKAGIKGLTYMDPRDGQSFVVFDDKAIRTIERYNQIIGESGANRLSNAEQVRADLTTAREMEAAGKKFDIIRLATGWERGADGKWRYELQDGEMTPLSVLAERAAQIRTEEAEHGKTLRKIAQQINEARQLKRAIHYLSLDDRPERWAGKDAAALKVYKEAQALIKQKGAEAAAAEIESQIANLKRRYDDESEAHSFFSEHKLEDVYASDELYKAYPQLRNMRVVFADLQGQAWGRQHPGQNLVEIEKSLSDAQARSILIHEIQHEIQDIEGFSRGADQESAWRALSKNLDEARDEMTHYLEQHDLVEYARIDRALWTLQGEENREKWAELFERFKVLGEHIPDEVIREYEYRKYRIGKLEDALSRRQADPWGAYTLVAGEVEADVAGKSANLSEEERRKKSLRSRERARRGEQVFIGGHEAGPAYSAQENSEAPLSAEPRRPHVTARNIQDVRDALRPQRGQIFTNRATGTEATFGSDQIEKMVCEKARRKSEANGFTHQDHFTAAANVGSLFEIAQLGEIHEDTKKHSPDIISIKRFFAPFESSQGPATVKITVKEIRREGHRIYSVEVLEIEKSDATQGGQSSVSAEPTPVASDNQSLSQTPSQRNNNSMFRTDDVAAESLPYLQARNDQQQVRGSIQIGPNGEGIITLFKDADRSTFFHELGHLFLDNLITDALSGVSERTQKDLDTVRKYLGIEDLDLSKRHMFTGEEQARYTEAQERFARSWEAYLMEGVAPTPEMRGIFARLKRWLIDIYKDVVALDVELSDDVRNVFDHLLMTEDEIEAAETTVEQLAAVDDMTDDRIGELEKEIKPLSRVMSAQWDSVGLDETNMPAWVTHELIDGMGDALAEGRPALVNAIRKLGGIKYDSVVATWGEGEAKELRARDRSLFRKDGAAFDTLVTELEHEGIHVNDAQDLYDRLMAQEPKITKGLNVAITEGTLPWLFYLMDDGEVRDYAASRQRLLNRELKALQDADDHTELRSRGPEIAKEQDLIREILDTIKKPQQQKAEVSESDDSAFVGGDADLSFGPPQGDAVHESIPTQEAADRAAGLLRDDELISLKEADRRAWRRAARESRRAYFAGKQTGAAQVRAKVAALKEAQRKRKAERDEINKAVKFMKKALVDKQMSWTMQQKIKAKLDEYTLSRPNKNRLASARELLDYIEQTPDAELSQFNPSDQRYVKMLETTTLNDMTLADVRALRQEIEAMALEGREQFDRWTNEREARRQTAFSELMATLGDGAVPQNEVKTIVAPADLEKQYKGLKGKLVKAKDWTLANTMGANRFFDWLGGGKGDYKSVWTRYFVDRINEALDDELRHSQSRYEQMEQLMSSLGLSFEGMNELRNVDGQFYSVDQLIHIYAGLKNEASRKAITYGNMRLRLMRDGESGVQEHIAHCVSALSDAERQLGDAVIADFNVHFDRINNALIDAFNQGMKHEENYTPMARLEYSAQALNNILNIDENQMIEGEASMKGTRNTSVEKGFLEERMEIDDEHQQPIKLGLLSLWHDQVHVQEHTAAYGKLAGDLRSMLMKRDEHGITIGRRVVDVFGRDALAYLREYTNIAIQGQVITASTVLDGMYAYLGRNMAIAYLTLNFGTILKQFTSLPRFIVTAGPVYLANAMGQFLMSQRKGKNLLLDEIYKLDPQMKNRAPDAFLQVLKDARQSGNVKSSYMRMLEKMMAPISVMDRTVSAIGWWATYQRGLKNGLSKAEAVREAQRAVALTQQTPLAKDMPRVWNQNGMMRLMMIFTSDMANTWGMSIYDLTHSATGRDRLMTVAALASTALLMGMVSGGPDDDDEFIAWYMKQLMEQQVGAAPIIGKEVMSAIDAMSGRFGRSNYSALTAPLVKIMQGSSGVFADDADKIYPDGTTKRERSFYTALEGLSLLVPFPFTTLNRIRRALNSDDGGEAARIMLGMRLRRRNR